MRPRAVSTEAVDRRRACRLKRKLAGDPEVSSESSRELAWLSDSDALVDEHEEKTRWMHGSGLAAVPAKRIAAQRELPIRRLFSRRRVCPRTSYFISRVNSAFPSRLALASCLLAETLDLGQVRFGRFGQLTRRVVKSFLHARLHISALLVVLLA